jgi:hypothetical protein
MALIPMKVDQLNNDAAIGELKFESVDQIVLDQISAIESDFYDKKLLLDIYRNI